MEESQSNWGRSEFLGLLLVVFAVWSIVTQGPVSWYLFGSLVIWACLYGACEIAKEGAEADRRLRRKILVGALEDTVKIFRNLSIGSGFVLLVQLSLNLFGGEADPSSFGRFELWIWDAIATLKEFSSLGAVALIVTASIILSAIFRSHLPTVISSKARKLLGTVATFLASIYMFTFVAADSGEANYTRESEPIRAAMAVKLTETARDRKEAAAYRWATDVIERKQANDPEEIRATREYFASAERICEDFEQVYKEGVTVDTTTQRTALGPVTGSSIFGRANSGLTVAPFGTSADAGAILGSSSTQTAVVRIPRDSLCNKPELAGQLTSHLVNFPTAADAPPTNGLPPFDRNGGQGSEPPRDYDTERADDLPESAKGRASTWLPEFVGVVIERPSSPEGSWRETGDFENVIEMKPVRLGLLKSLKHEVDSAASDASTTRAALRGVAIKAVDKLIGESFKQEGIAGKLLDALRDAVLSELALRGEARLKDWLRSGAQGEGVVSRASHFLSGVLFTEAPLSETVLAAGLAKIAAKNVWDTAHPEAKDLVAVRKAARASVLRPFRPAMVGPTHISPWNTGGRAVLPPRPPPRPPIRP